MLLFVSTFAPLALILLVLYHRMRLLRFVLPLILSVSAGLAPNSYAAEPNATDWIQDFSKQSQLLAKEVRQARAEMPKRVLDPDFRKSLLRHEILGRVPPSLIVRFLKSPEEQKFLSDFLSESEWMEPFVSSGPLDNPLIAVLSLAAISMDDPNAMTSDLERRIAISTALETALVKRTPENAIKVYRYYRDRARAGLLHPGFSKLAVWEMRFAVGGRFAAEDLEYIGNRSSFSAKDAVNAGWQVNYVWYNPFGEYVHSDPYYRPWVLGGLSYTQCRVEIGGVCGAISTTGLAATQANGIPAVFMNEPGHYSYAVRIGPGEWQVGNSIDANKRWPQRHYFQENWSDLLAGDEAWLNPALPKAQGLAWASHALPVTDVAGRSSLLDQANDILPGHAGNWQERIELAKLAKARNEWWVSAAQEVVAAFPKYPHVSWTLLNAMPLKQLPRATHEQIHSIWLTSCGKSPTDAIDLFAADEVIGDILAQRGRDNLNGVVNEVLAVSKTNPKLGSKLTKACSDVIEREMRQCAEKSDKAGWNRLGQEGEKLVKADFPHEHTPFAGELLSKGGLLRLSSAFQSSIYLADSPLTHPRVLNGMGGFFHTGEESHPEATIELGSPGTLSGIVLINRADLAQRAVPLKVSVSMDGKKWDQVFRSEKAESVWRVDLGAINPLARYVKVEGDYPEGRKDFLHLHGVFVYGKRAQR